MKSPSFPVVGVGASAGGLTAVTDLLKHLPPDVRAAFVIIQHLDPKHGSLATDILSRVSPLPVDEIKDGMRIRPAHVYIIPPNRNMHVEHGVLALTPRAEGRGLHLPIDLFFRSLAQDRKAQAIGVVLSGIASDGTLGVQAIKSEGGFTFAQEPASAQYDGMPRSAILSGAVDVVDTPEGIAREIVKISSVFSKQPAERALIIPEREQAGSNGNLRKIFSLILSATGVDFTLYKHSTIQRRIARRLVLLKMEDLQTYAAYLGTHPEEVQALFADILIHVTSFFRDDAAYEALKSRILPRYLENWDSSVPFRIWVPGCSSGEEAYSIAILLSEFLDNARLRLSFQIFASDISESSLQKARAALYPEGSVKEVSKIRLNRFFEKVEGGFRIAKKVRDTVLFSRHDVTADPPFAKIDLISCRNLLIYFTSELQKRVVPILHYALNPGGILWLGPSETIAGFERLFKLEDRTNKFYSKKTIAVPVRFQFPLSRQPEAFVTRKRAVVEPTLQEVQTAADRIAVQRYAPPGVVISDAAEILHVRGRPAPYIELSQGQASLNLFKLAHPEIVSDLKYLIHAARRENAPTTKRNLTLKRNGSRQTYGITVVPIPAIPSSKERYYSIFFEEASGSEEPVQRPPAQPGKARPKGKRRIAYQDRLEDRTYQQELIEEYETTQEELISANEELQSTNEELQSTNEELETAKEELQSANEEMSTINDELQARNVEMSQLTNDLTNLLASVDIPIVMVGPDARIRRFTPKAGQTLNLIPSDVGRSIGDIRSGIDVPKLADMVAEVMATLSLKEMEVQDQHGSWYRLQVRPYRTADNRIDGAVITLTDITVLKRAAEVLQAAHDDARKIIETMPTPIVVISSDRRVQRANASFYSMFQLSPPESEGKLLTELCDGHWNIPGLQEVLETVFREGIPFHDFEVEHDFPNVGHKDMVFHATATRLTGAGVNTALLAIEDLTVRKQIADRLRHTEARYRHLLENANDGIVIVDQNGKIEFANRRVEVLFGYSPGELKDQTYEILIPEQDLEIHRKHHAQFMHQPVARDMGRDIDLRGKRKDGTVIPVEISLSPVTVDAQVVVTAIIRDITDRRLIEAGRRELLARETEARHEAERRVAIKDDFLATLSHELRSPISVVLTWAQTLRSGKLDPDKAARALAAIEKSAKDQGQLIEDLLDVSRIRAGKLLLDLHEIDPRDCIVAAVDSTRNQADAKSIAIEIDLDPSPCVMKADSFRLEQVFRNLLTNAVKFTPAGGKITVRSQYTKDREGIEFQVEDNGQGIAPAFLPHLFERFSQEDSSRVRSAGGLGLGLSIVRNLVEMHGGHVTAYSQGEGKGAVFTVTLPCGSLSQGDRGETAGAGQATAAATGSVPNLGRMRVLVIDDLEDAREAFSAMLETAGAHVEAAASAAAGRAALSRFKPDIVLCDVAMPGEDGLSFIRSVRKLGPRRGGTMLAIAVTAHAGVVAAQQALEAGFDAHLAKPVDAKQLSSLIAELLEKKRRSARSDR